MAEDEVEVENEKTNKRAKLGWCMEGRHTACPAMLPQHEWPDPSGRGTYRSPALICPCPCHKRDNLD